mgnify:FL=1
MEVFCSFYSHCYRMSDVLTSETWKTATSGTLRISDPNPRPSARPYHATVSGRLRSNSRVALIDGDFHAGTGREVGTFRARNTLSIFDDSGTAPQNATAHPPANSRRLPVPAAFRNGMISLRASYFHTKYLQLT